MELIGAICPGLVWGWLAAHLHRPAARPRRSATILVLVTVAAAAYHGWRLGPGGALGFGLAALAGALLAGALVERVQREG